MAAFDTLPVSSISTTSRLYVENNSFKTWSNYFVNVAFPAAPPAFSILRGDRARDGQEWPWAKAVS